MLCSNGIYFACFCFMKQKNIIKIGLTEILGLGPAAYHHPTQDYIINTLNMAEILKMRVKTQDNQSIH